MKFHFILLCKENSQKTFFLFYCPGVPVKNYYIMNFSSFELSECVYNEIIKVIGNCFAKRGPLQGPDHVAAESEL